MRRRTFWLAIVLLVSNLALQPTGVVAQPSYAVEDLGTIDGLVPTVLGMNEHGEVVGFVVLNSGESRPVRYVDSAGWTYVPGLEASNGALTAINDLGGLAGHRVVFDAFLAFRHESGVATELGTFGGSLSLAYGINDEGIVVGVAYLPGNMAHTGFRAWPGGWLQDLGTLGGTSSAACGVNRHGHVVGYAQTASGLVRLFRLTDDEEGMTELGTLGGPESRGCAINAAGQVAGTAQTATNAWRAVRYTDGEGLVNLDAFGSVISMAKGINDAGDVVGFYWAAAGSRAFLYTDDQGALDLNGRIDASSGWTLLSAHAINNAGQLIGQGLKDSESRAFRLTPLIASDVEPPTIESASVSPSVLWPPDGRIVPVQVRVVASDNLDPASHCWIAGIDDSEPSTNGFDAHVTGDLTAELRAARTGDASGRTYLLNVICADATGNEAGTSVVVSVPHDRGRTQGAARAR